MVGSLTLQEAADALDVSVATLRNWIKLNVLIPENNKPITFSSKQISDFSQSIKSGNLNKLNSRANKYQLNDAGRILHHLIGIENKNLIEELIFFHKKNKSSTSNTIAFLNLLLLKHKKLVDFSEDLKVINIFNDLNWVNDFVKKEFDNWVGILNSHEILPISDFCNVNIDSEIDDLLGITYQGIIHGGSRAKLGSFYTPAAVIDMALDQMSFTTGNFLDPTCGTGQYLIRAIRKFGLKAEEVYGFDVDPIAIQIARFNLMNEFDFSVTKTNLYCEDTIFTLSTEEMDCQTNHYLSYFDAIATNPPWGALRSTKKTIPRVFETTSGEMFSLVIEKSLKLLKDNGSMSFLLPESFLNVASHRDIREIVLKKTAVGSIRGLGNPFPGVMTKVISISAVKMSKTNNEVSITPHKSNMNFEVHQSKFLNNPNFVISLTSTSLDEEILSHIYKLDSNYLDNSSGWALGIVTGNNKKYLRSGCEENYVGVLRGSEIKPFLIEEPKVFLELNPNNFQQVPALKFFSQPEKLLYKFISKRLTFALDTKKQFTLNSANILIPRIPDYDIKVVMAFLNSNVLQYVHLKRFSTHKILKNNLMALPFPRISQEMHSQILGEVNGIMKLRKSELDLQSLIYQCYELNDDQILHIESQVS